jgi:cobalt/nickel transport system ATP-binding protein
MIGDLCSRTIILHDGKVASDGPTWSVLMNRELLATCGLELPLRLQGCPICGKA